MIGLRWLVVSAALMIAAAGGGLATEPPVNQHAVVPVVLRHCVVCHGRQRQEGGLDLRTRAGMLRGGESGPAIVLGQPEQSLVIKRIRAGEMPPKANLLNSGTTLVRAADLARLARWIEMRAPHVSPAPDVAGTPNDPLVDDDDRDFWAFRPPQPVAIPSTEAEDRPQRNPIDAFVLRKLKRAGLTFSPPAERLTLLRRTYFDLTGLPPEPDDVDRFLSDTRPDAYERLIERLLAAPRYGERWARHWLDLVGYADSWGGKLEADHARTHAWRFRDYVIRSLNADKPYDRFLLEQIAGDELVDYENTEFITEDIYDNLVATGFLRMAHDSTSEREVSFVSDRVDVIADEIDVFSSTVLGLTMKCARCHDHQYDPIPQRDYYRLFAVFKGAYDEYDWLKPVAGTERKYKFEVRTLPFVTTAERKQRDRHNAELKRDIETLQHNLELVAQQRRQQQTAHRLAQLPQELARQLSNLLETPADDRDETQEQLAKKHQAILEIGFEELKALDPEFNEKAVQTDAQTKVLQAKMLGELGVQALWDRGEPSPTYIYLRGESDNPGPPVEPGAPAVLTTAETPFRVEPPWPGAKQTGRRLALARWVTRDTHPLTARVMVNRIWKHHFGTGIVATLANFGQTGSEPSHPELLDWLALEFVRQGWSMKHMHRLMMTSTAYRQSSRLTSEQGSASSRSEIDPSNRLVSRMPLRRMEAEVLRDTLLFVVGRLNDTYYGRSDPVIVRPEGLVTSVETPAGWRRSIYVKQRRKEVPTILAAFDLPAMNPNCIERAESTVAPQALHLMNNAMIDKLAVAFAERVRAESGTDVARQLERIYLIAFSRRPDEQERRLGREALARLTEFWAETLPSEVDKQYEASQRALTTYCHTMINSAEFLYID